MNFQEPTLPWLRRCGLVSLLFAVCAAALAGCVATPNERAAGKSKLAFTGPVKLSCDDGMQMTITPRSGGISVVSPRGVELDLPASPPGQSVRFGEGLYAVVIEGGEALWMVSGKVPITCRR
ncbi:hypothetical protein AB2N04_04015 [Nitratireductor sp. GISD-1A_MAKvit]|uniref:hypothetical protein n=1 Tax=Nitratireductor sp. GISD-1A_MAKvit TaxID=3234198 RepID=UPI0034673D6C